MIETAMLVGMGFCAATLVALMVMPLVSYRARRRVERRWLEHDPPDARVFAAERDGLRARAAVEQRRGEQRLEHASRAQAEMQGELGRRAAQIHELEQTGEAERTRMAAEIAQTREAAAAAQARFVVVEKALAEENSRNRLLEDEALTLAAKRDEAAALAEERQSAVTQMSTRLRLLEARLADRDGTLERERQDAVRLRADLSDTTRDRDLARKELLLATTQRIMVEADLKDLNRRAEDLRDRLQARTSDLASAERRIVEERAEKRAAEAALAELRVRFQRLEAMIIETGGSDPGKIGDTELKELRAAIADVSDQALSTLAPSQ